MMHGVRSSIFVLLALALIPPSEALGASRHRGCTAVKVGSPQQPRGRGYRPKYFSASEILDLELAVSVRRRRGPEQIKIKLYTPNGHLYQTLKLPVDASRRLNARGRPSRWVVGTLPVAGTTIVWASLYGKWKAEVYADGSEKRCRATRFVIAP